jgi:pyoverdine/dityrosine biosynthesis protein Dit1
LAAVVECIRTYLRERLATKAGINDNIGDRLRLSHVEPRGQNLLARQARVGFLLPAIPIESAGME